MAQVVYSMTSGSSQVPFRFFVLGGGVGEESSLCLTNNNDAIVQNSSFTWQQLTSSLPGMHIFKLSLIYNILFSQRAHPIHVGVYYHSACTVGTDMVIVGGVNNTGDSVGQVFTIQLGSCMYF